MFKLFINVHKLNGVQGSTQVGCSRSLTVISQSTMRSYANVYRIIFIVCTVLVFDSEFTHP